MTNTSKTALKIGLFAYFIIAVLSILNQLKIEGLEDVLKISIVNIPITTIILLAYVQDRGEDGLFKIGILCILVNIVITALTAYGVVKSAYSSEAMLDKVVASVRDVASGGVSICGILALLSIIPIADDRSNILKVVSVLAYMVFMSINVADNFISVYDSKLLSVCRSLASYVSSFAEYAFIVFYLLNKQVDPVKENIMDNPGLQQPSIVEQPATEPQAQPIFNQPPMYQQPQQPMPQQVAQPVVGQPQMPGVNPEFMTPPVYQPITEPVAVVEQPTEPVTEPVTQPAPTGPMIPQIVMPTTAPQQQ